MNESISNSDYSASHHEKKPAPSKKEEILGQGAESVAKKYGDHYVVKEIQTLTPEGLPKPPEHLKILKSREFVDSVRKDQKKLLEIYKDQMLETVFVSGLDDNGEETYYRLQEKVKGRTADEERKKLGNEKFKEEYRDELLRLLYATKKATVELGVPVDMHSDNVMVDDNKKLKLIDFGAPTLLQEVLRDFPDEEKRAEKYKQVARIFDRIKHFEETMEITDTEKSKLSQIYSFGEDEEKMFLAKEESWDQEMKDLGIT